MKNVQTILKEKAKQVFGSGVFIAPEIPEKKLNNAISKYGNSIPVESVVILFDSTIWGSAKAGMLFSGTRMIWKEDYTDPIAIEYSDINSVVYSEVEKEVEDKDGNKKIVVVKSTLITLKDEKEIRIKGVSECNYRAMAEMLNDIIAVDEEYADANQILTLNEMHPDLKLSYMKILVNMTFSDDGVVDSKEYAELLSLICRLEFSAEERVMLRSYINDVENQDSNVDLMAIINSHTPKGNEKALRFSLVKDIINIYLKTDQEKVEGYPFLEDNQELFQVGEDEIKLAELAIENDLKLINGELSAEELNANMKNLGLKAAAIGVPLAAIYMSGSVIGLGVTGIITGLAGLGSIIGFGSLIPGVGVAVLLGMGAYSGLKALSGGAQTGAQRKRELLLQGVVRSTHKTINILIEDINYISQELISALKLTEGQSAQLEKLKKLLTLYASAGTALNSKVSSIDIEIQKSRCPIQIDVKKLTNLTQEPTKAKYFSLVMANYQELKSTDEEGRTAVEYKLKDDLSYQDYESLSNTINAIGYGSLQGGIKDVKSKAIEGIKGLFG